MKRLWMFLVAVLCLLVALGAGFVANAQYEALVATTELVVPATEIPPYTVLTPAMLTTRVFPAPVANEPVYRTIADATGKMTRIPLAPQRPIYTDQAVPARAFRYTDDDRLEVVSFPVAPEQAVGGQIKIGQRITIYRIALARAPQTVNAKPELLLATSPAAVDILATNITVVDIRTTGGATLNPPPKTTKDGQPQQQQQTQERPLTILTVAVAPEIARDIVRLMGELKDTYTLWLSLTPPADANAETTR